MLNMMLNKRGNNPLKPNEDSIEEDANEEEEKDPLKDQFLNKLGSMYEKVKIYNEAFYDREPRYIHVSPAKVLNQVQNK